MTVEGESASIGGLYFSVIVADPTCHATSEMSRAAGMWLVGVGQKGGKRPFHHKNRIILVNAAIYKQPQKQTLIFYLLNKEYTTLQSTPDRSYHSAVGANSIRFFLGGGVDRGHFWGWGSPPPHPFVPAALEMSILAAYIQECFYQGHIDVVRAL